MAGIQLSYRHGELDKVFHTHELVGYTCGNYNKSEFPGRLQLGLQTDIQAEKVLIICTLRLQSWRLILTKYSPNHLPHAPNTTPALVLF